MSACVKRRVTNCSALFRTAQSLAPTHTRRGSDLRKPSILLSSATFLPTPPPAQLSPGPRRPPPGPTRATGGGQSRRPGPSGPPRPVLTPAAVAVTADCPAERAERSRLRPICSRLRNSLDRSRGSVAEEAEWLCSSRLLRRTTIFPSLLAWRPQRQTGSSQTRSLTGSSALRILAPQAPRQRPQRAHPESLRLGSRPRLLPETGDSKLSAHPPDDRLRAEVEEDLHRE